MRLIAEQANDAASVVSGVTAATHEVAIAARDINAQSRVVAETARALASCVRDEGDAERCIAAGCDGYISKPIDILALPSAVAGYLVNKTGTT